MKHRLCRLCNTRPPRRAFGLDAEILLNFLSPSIYTPHYIFAIYLSSHMHKLWIPSLPNLVYVARTRDPLHNFFIQSIPLQWSIHEAYTPKSMVYKNSIVSLKPLLRKITVIMSRVIVMITTTTTIIIIYTTFLSICYPSCPRVVTTALQ